MRFKICFCKILKLQFGALVLDAEWSLMSTGSRVDEILYVSLHEEFGIVEKTSCDK